MEFKGVLNSYSYKFMDILSQICTKCTQIADGIGTAPILWTNYQNFCVLPILYSFYIMCELRMCEICVYN